MRIPHPENSKKNHLQRLYADNVYTYDVENLLEQITKIYNSIVWHELFPVEKKKILQGNKRNVGSTGRW